MTTLSLAFGQAIATPASPDAGVSFGAYDVVSVKPSNIDRPRLVGAREVPDGIDGVAVTVAMLVQGAYGAPLNLPTDEAVTGLPDWAKSDYFSVQAKMNPDQVAAFAMLSADERRQRRRAMLQALLADRFKLKVHIENRQVLVYELVVARGGSKMKEGDTNPDGQKLSNGRPVPLMMTITPSGMEEVITQGNSMDQLANFLTHGASLEHRVVDKTGLTGKYSFTLTFAASRGVGPPTAAGPTDANASDPAPMIFQALEAQLGLRLQRGTETIDVVVADHVERPSAN